MHTTRISFDAETYQLPVGADLTAIMERVESAARSEPTFVTFAAAHELISVLVGMYTRVTVTVDPSGDEESSRPAADDWADWEL